MTAVPTLEPFVRQAVEALRPPERMTVSEAAAKYRTLNNRGSYAGPWLNETTPYLVEPMNTFTDPKLSGSVFVGPSQSGKTDMFLNYLAYTVMCDPADLLLVHMTQLETEAFSKTRVAKLHRDSPKVGARLMAGASNDAVRFKRYINGTILQFGFPTITQLSGKPIPRVFFTDYDRFPQDIDGEGAPFSLGEARTTTFGRYAKVIAESSPGFPVVDPEWSPNTPHEAPPTEGILALYNRGDRRRWYWICVICHHAFEPDFKLMRWPDSKDSIEAGEECWLECPSCEARYREQQSRVPGRRVMNLRGLWLREGEKVTTEGEIIGTPLRARFASFWLKGPAAAFGSWASKVTQHIDAKRMFEQTGSETELEANTNTVWGVPYIPRALELARLPESLRARSQDYGQRVVPRGVRFLIAAIDVQSRKFEVQVHGIGVGGDIWIVDRFAVALSAREDERREGQVHGVRPFSEPWDWRLLLDQVLCRTYELSDGSGRRMVIKGVVCDSGGGKGTTANAYAWWRWLKRGPKEDDDDPTSYENWSPELYRRVLLFKGVGKRPGYRQRIAYPDSGKRTQPGAAGEIPLLEVAVNEIKDELDSRLNREDSGSGMIRFPDWLDFEFYRELCSETLNEKREWEKIGRRRNEAWDLLVMTIAFCLSPRQVGLERLDWENPPTWADEWNRCDLVYDPQKTPNPTSAPSQTKPSFEQLARDLA